MKTFEEIACAQIRRLALVFGATLVTLLITPHSQAFPIGGVTFKDNSPFMGSYGSAPLTSSDGLLTVAGWADTDATVPANLWQWWWILGVDSGVGNGALLDGTEAMTFQLDKGVGSSMIVFLDAGGIGGANNNLARINISGFLRDPGAFAITHNAPRISNLTYQGGTLSFDYLSDGGGDYGQLLFANPGGSGGQRLKITGAVSPNGDATSWGAGLFSANWQEAFGAPSLTAVNVRDNYTNSYTTADGALTVRGFSDASATTPANFGTYLDQCFGVYGGANNGAIDTDESVTLQFAGGIGLARLDAIYSAGQVSISGFASDPGFTDPANGSSGASYSGGVVSFSPIDGGRHIYFFTNRSASAGRTLQINVDPASGNQLAIAGVQYANLQTVIAGDIPSNVTSTHSTADGLLTLNAFADTPGTVPANLYVNGDWFGVAGGNNNEAIEGAESLELQFSGGAGLAGFGTRYASGQVILSGFASDPGFSDPSGTATDVSYSGGTLTYTFNAYRSPELLVTFTKLSASTGRTVSMHTDGNAGSQIALTRISYAVAQPTLNIARIGTNIVLTWSTGTLQQSTQVSGSYGDVIGALSPYTNAISGLEGYFRVKVQ
jgi:hypothetical protein